MPRPRRWVRRHSLSLVLSVVLAAFLAVSFVTGMYEFRSEQLAHGERFAWSAFWTWWGYETVTSLEADVFGAIVLVTFTKWFFEERSAEAKEPPGNGE